MRRKIQARRDDRHSGNIYDDSRYSNYLIKSGGKSRGCMSLRFDVGAYILKQNKFSWGRFNVK